MPNRRSAKNRCAPEGRERISAFDGAGTCRLAAILCACLLYLLLNPVAASAQQSYRFERMWPTLPQPWYLSPFGIAVSEDGFVYIADSSNRRMAVLRG